MIRKRIALFFLLFATTLLLAHAVVPHHHHKEHICLLSHHCQPDCPSSHHGIPGSDHRHEGQNDAEFCVLKQVVFIPSTQNHFDKHWPEDDKPLSFPDFQAIVPANEWKSALPDVVISRHVFQTRSILTNLIVSFPGLRAPPSV